MRWSIPTVRKKAREAMRAQHVRGSVVSAEWLGEWARPRSGEGPDFRIARLILELGGFRVVRHFTAERNGDWMIR